MPDFGTATPAGIGLAGGAVAGALIETLLESGVINLAQARGALDTAIKALGPHMKTPEGFQASQILTAMLSGKFSERR